MFGIFAIILTYTQAIAVSRFLHVVLLREFHRKIMHTGNKTASDR